MLANQANTVILRPEDVIVGDVLLCFTPQDAYTEEGEVGYSHVAISLGDGEVLHAENSVEITNISALLENYHHLAVLRSQDIWHPQNVEALRQFSRRSAGKKFNSFGKLRIRDRKSEHSSIVIQRVEEHFDGKTLDDGSVQGAYFCSQLVTAAFIQAGVIGGGAQIVFKPDTFTPGDIAKDKAFGFLQGFLTSDEKYHIPLDDWFRTNF